MQSLNPSVNDFVIRFANVNGTGSASANKMFATSIFKMGIPVTAKNIFPSNIQGLPTWYEVRINDKGYLGRRDGLDIMVCLNPQSIKRDVEAVRPGGYFLYDSTKYLVKEFIREDVHYLGIPMTEICNTSFEDPRYRQLLKNMVYVGALSALLDIEHQVLKDIIHSEFKNKEKLIAPNEQALQMGIDYARKHFDCPLDIRVERRNLNGDSIVMDGNTACALGAIYAGATVAAWYPITPSTSVVSSFEKYANKLRVDKENGLKNFAVVQAEDELSAVGIAIGANWNGARGFTATSGPGLSLMNEFLGLAYFAEIPVVLVDVQRGGPSTGMPTRTQQSDLMMAAYASHGDTKHVLLFPSNPKECFEHTAYAFDLAERLQTPVIVMTDLDLGMNEHLSPPLKWDDKRKYDRGKVLNAEQLEKIEKWGRYLDIDGDGVPYRTLPGTHPIKGAYFTRGSSHDEFARYTEDSHTYVHIMDRLLLKWNTAKKLVYAPQIYNQPSQSSIGILFFGTTTYAALEAIDLLNEEGIKLDALRITAFPFQDSIEKFIQEHKTVFIIEQNRDAQMKKILSNELEIDKRKLISILNYDGTPITANFIHQSISRITTQSLTLQQ
ncbi:MAG: 2-oxoacid:acceptor oxidoreductase subunit alpha [Sphingobacteriales bacterium]|nr:2-oxoacid:acceptor oxidoreductase subunit alpha [Sphingobacteriales bacterium]